MKSTISSATAHPGDPFEAVLDAPVIVDGATLVRAGAKARGKVVAVRASSGVRDPGYLRLMLTEISIGDKPLALQTSSVFAKASSSDVSGSLLVPASVGHDSGQRDVRFAANSWLTFRLTQSLQVPD